MSIAEEYAKTLNRDLRLCSRPTYIALKMSRWTRIRWFFVRNLRRLGMRVEWWS